MPGFDGTGPGGCGPGTGGGRGYCYPEAGQGNQQERGSRRGQRWGQRGQRWGRGGQRWGRGGQRWGQGQPGPGPLPQEFSPPPPGYAPRYEAITLEQEKEFLGTQIKNLDAKTNEIRMRLDEISQEQAREETKKDDKEINE